MKESEAFRLCTLSGPQSLVLGEREQAKGGVGVRVAWGRVPNAGQ